MSLCVLLSCCVCSVLVPLILLTVTCSSLLFCFFFFFQAEDGIRDLVRSRGLGDVYKRQIKKIHYPMIGDPTGAITRNFGVMIEEEGLALRGTCLLYTSDAADERSSVDLGGRRIIKKKKKTALAVGGERVTWTVDVSGEDT
mgnify:CR=1 FL=1